MSIFTILILLCRPLAIVNAQEANKDQRELINSGLRYYDYATCSVAPPSVPNNGGGGSEENEKATWIFLTNSLSGMGLAPAQAAGVMGNLNQESTGFQPSTIEASGGGGFGLAQWTGPRRTAIEEEAAKRGVDPNDFAFQLDWLKITAERDYADMMVALRATQDPTEATYIWHGSTSESSSVIPKSKYNFEGYESSGDGPEGIAERVADAKMFLEKWGSTVVSGSLNVAGSIAASSKDIYIVGDSLSVGLRDSGGIEQKLKDKGASSITINGSVGRAISVAGNSENDKTSAEEAINADKDKIAKSGSAIILLGTNPENDFKNKMPAFVNKLKEFNKDIKISWVNVGITAQNLVENQTVVNTTLSENKANINGVIDWGAKVKEEPTLLSADGVHPTDYNKFADFIIEKFAPAPTNTGSVSACTCSGPATSNGKTVFLDPGHGPTYENIDAASGLMDKDWDNGAETKDVWEIAENAKKELEQKGYKVIMSKDSVLGSPEGFRIKAEKANNAGAAIAVSLHTTGGPDFVWHQIDGSYRQYGESKLTFNNPEVAAKSAEYAKIFTETRKTTENISNIIETPHTYEGANNTSSGNIALIMLFGDKVPWVYLEKGTGGDGSTNRALTPEEKEAYKKSVVDSVSKAIPVDGQSGGTTTAAQTQSGGCGNGTSAQGVKGMLDLAKQYAWEDGRRTTEHKPEYKKAIDERKANNLYIGGYDGIDCGGFVATVVDNSKVDPDKPYIGQTSVAEKYMTENSTKYQKLSVTSTNDLQPGDIGVINAGDGQGANGHIYMFTGKLTESFNGNAAEASLGGAAPTATNAYINDDRGDYKWFRIVN